jgi:1,4-alpha-glucan branching enzyme
MRGSQASLAARKETPMQTQAPQKIQRSETPLTPTQPTASPVTFQLKAPEAKKVFLAGDFTNWHLSARPLKRKPDGTWHTQILLEPGRYQYKFIVDGQWQNDPDNDEFVPNEFGTVNNVREVKP